VVKAIWRKDEMLIISVINSQREVLWRREFRLIYKFRSFKDWRSKMILTSFLPDIVEKISLYPGANIKIEKWSEAIRWGGCRASS